jgi:acetyltransferase-like isoleucine patch superfamily enzyme
MSDTRKSKVKKFLQSEEKKVMADAVLAMIWCQLTMKNRFAYFGMGGYLLKPDRLIGTKYISVGRNVSILHHARIETVSLYGNTRFTPQLTIGDNTSIGQNLHLVCAGDLTIGKNVVISGNVFISDTLHDYKEIDVQSTKQTLIYKHTEIGDYCFIGYGAVIQAGAVLGKQCIVGSNAVVREGIYPPYTVLAGVPAKVVKKYNSESLCWEKQKEVE